MSVAFRGVAVGVAVALMSVVACTGSEPDLVPSGAVDAGADAGAVAGDLLAPGSGGFETAGCRGWTPNEAKLTAVPEPHGGTSACRVCASGDTSVWGIFQTVERVAAGPHEVAGFARTSGEDGPFEVYLRVAVTDEAGNETSEQREAKAMLVPGQAFSQLSAELTTTRTANLAVAVLSNTAGGCFLVDDVSLTRK